MESMLTLAIIAGAFFMTMFLMRWTFRQSQRDRPEGLRWRGIDWTGVKLPERDTDQSAPTRDEQAPPPT
jgi:hypothetical protein